MSIYSLKKYSRKIVLLLKIHMSGLKQHRVVCRVFEYMGTHGRGKGRRSRLPHPGKINLPLRGGGGAFFSYEGLSLQMRGLLSPYGDILFYVIAFFLLMGGGGWLLHAFPYKNFGGRPCLNIGSLTCFFLNFQI